MLRLSLNLLLLLAAYLFYLFAPIPGLSELDHRQLHDSKNWKPGNLGVIYAREEKSSNDELWLTGSSVAASFFPNNAIDSHFGQGQSRMLHLSFMRAQHLNAIFGEKGLMPIPNKMVLMIGPDFLFSSWRGQVNGFTFLRMNRALAWRLSCYSKTMSTDHLYLNDSAMNNTLAIKDKKNVDKIKNDARTEVQKADKNGFSQEEFVPELDELITFKNYLKANRCELLLVILPLQQVMFEESGLLKNNIEILESRCQKENIPLLNLSREPLETKAFIDWGHYSPNAAGLNIYRKKIADWVKTYQKKP